MNISNFGFTRWNFQFEIDGSLTLDPEINHKFLRRIEGRKRLFMDPLLKSGFLKGKRVLDIGCNSGYWSLLALKEGEAEHITGIDASPELIEQAKFVFNKKGVPSEKYDFYLEDIYQYLNKIDQQFDVVLCLGFFYHINDPINLMSLMSKVCKSYLIIDTVVHKSDEALISLRPVQNKSNLIDRANITLELVTSKKGIFWIAEETGFPCGRQLIDKFENISSMWDYIREQRMAFAFSKGDPISRIWESSINPNFLSIKDDLLKYGYFPEMKDGPLREG